jgi:protein-disulfide isomerase
MAKRKRPVRRSSQPERSTNWWLIGGIVVAVVLVVGLLALAIQEPGGTTTSDLIQYCQENPDNCVAKGSADAPVTIVEVSDYGCSHCRDFNLETAGLIEDLYVTPGDVQWITLPYALGLGTTPPAEAAFCAAEQDRYDDYHLRLFQLQGTQGLYETAGLVQVAADLGLDQDSFAACVDGGAYSSAVQRNIKAASGAGVNSTPTFVINDRIFPGNRPLTFFQDQIAELLGAVDES